MALLMWVLQVRRDVAETRPARGPVAAADRELFNTLLAAARRHPPRDVLLLGVSTAEPEAELTYGELLDAYERIALALG